MSIKTNTQLEILREHYADKLQSAFYFGKQSDFNDIAEIYCNINQLEGDEEEEAWQCFEIERTAGPNPPYSFWHKTVSDICWRIAQATDAEALWDMI